jgi:hypothetical protein
MAPDPAATETSPLASSDVNDVFLSYCHEDVARATQLRTQLWNLSRSVFMDTQTRPGTLWQDEIQRKLEAARCVVALWSRVSNASNVQFDEANYALSRGTLVIARLDTTELPLGLRAVQHIDLSTWQAGDDHPGIAQLYGRVHELIAAAKAKPEPVDAIERALSGKPDSADRHSVSNRTADEEAILSALGDVDQATRSHIREAYRQMAFALSEARLTLNDEAPRDHYENAANSFRQVLLLLSSEHKARRLPGHEMPVGYFLELEFANALVFSVPDTADIPKEALDLYEKLAARYPTDTAVFLRSGRARVKDARYARAGLAKREALQAAIRDLNKALSCAPFDPQVNPDHWVYFEAPLQIGICFWLISEFQDLPREKRIHSLETAISHTELAVNRKMPETDTDDFVKFVRLRAAGNIVYYSSLLLRNGVVSQDLNQAIKRQTAYLLADDSWAIVKNQPRIIDSIMCGATATEDWPLALRMAQLNSENFRKISFDRALQPDEREMWAKADATELLSQKLTGLTETKGELKDEEKAAAAAPRRRWFGRG